MERLLHQNPVTRTRRIWHHNVHEGEAIIDTQQDVSAITDVTKAMYAQTDERARWDDDYNHVASIPYVILMDLQRKGILDDEERFKAWLNDPDNRMFRTRPGRI